MAGVVGLDVGSDQVSVCILAPDGREITPRFEIANSQAGADDLMKRLGALGTEHEIDAWQIGIEATGLYWWPLAVSVSTATTLAPSRVTVYALNPKLVKDFRRNYGSLPKTDRHDAFVIADRVHFGRGLPAPFAVDWRYAPLQRLTRFRYHLVHTLTREKGYALSLLFLPFSGYGQVFTDGLTPTGMALLEDFTTEQVAEQEIEDLAAYLQKHGRGQFKDAEGTATALKQAAKDSYHLPSPLVDPLRIVLATTCLNVRTLQQELKQLDRAIAKELATITETVHTIPGLGAVLTAGLIAEIGAITRFPDEAALAQYAGLTWTVHESGHFQAEDTRLTKRGNAYLRYYLVEGANSVREHCPEYATYYQTKKAQTPKHAHKRALVLTARKLVRLVDALLRTDTIYQPPETRTTRKEACVPTTRRPARHHRSRPALATS